jgi:signal transduction histidine kinase
VGSPTNEDIGTPQRASKSPRRGEWCGAARGSDGKIQKNIRIENKIEAKATVCGDLQQICTVFRNLLANALKFTPAEGFVELTTKQEPAAWVVLVSEPGQASPERLLTIFSPTNFGHSVGTQRGEGLGLGRHICRDSVLAK